MKSCAATLTLNDLRILAYCGRPEEWTEEEVKEKKRKPKKYKFLTAAQRKFMQDKPLRRKRNCKKAAMVAAYSKTALWLATQMNLPENKQFVDQKKQFDEDNGTHSCCYFCSICTKVTSHLKLT